MDRNVTLKPSSAEDVKPSSNNRRAVRKVMIQGAIEADRDGNYMSIQNLKDIQVMSGQLAQIIQPGAVMEDWVEDKISAARQILSDLERFYSKGRASKAAMYDYNYPKLIVDKLLHRYEIGQWVEIAALAGELGMSRQKTLEEAVKMSESKRPIAVRSGLSARIEVDGDKLRMVRA